jgi:hypothetical protein
MDEQLNMIAHSFDISRDVDSLDRGYLVEHPVVYPLRATIAARLCHSGAISQLLTRLNGFPVQSPAFQCRALVAPGVGHADHDRAGRWAYRALAMPAMIVPGVGGAGRWPCRAVIAMTVCDFCRESGALSSLSRCAGCVSWKDALALSSGGHLHSSCL